MPYKFTFNAPDKTFECILNCDQCQAMTSRGNRRCRRRVCIGLPYCHAHLLYVKYLQIKESTIPNSGKGLFAFKPDATGDNEIIFHRGDTIIEYHGESVSSADLDDRYGDYTAPYAIQHSRHRFEDAACWRGIGAMANHQNARRANAEYTPRRDGRVWLRATKNIRQGQEIFCNYGVEYDLTEPTTNTLRAVRALRR